MHPGGTIRSGDVRYSVTETLISSKLWKIDSPDVALIPAIREISKEGDQFTQHSGAGLIKALAELQNPTVDKRYLREDFENLVVFARDVLGNNSVNIEVPYNQDDIYIEMDKKLLSIQNLGSGVSEVLILAFNCTIFKNQVVCIEEPEIHLHPTLQRKLISYLRKNTDNQYFITTHSSHFLDIFETSIFHVWLENGFSNIKRVINDREHFELCQDLGYAASDIIQANCLIWVEGPSDRVYIKKWLSEIAPDLVEGIHFTIMFYGGRLLSHLSTNDSEVQDFIKIQRINQNAAIVIDSDRSKRHQNISKTKKRIVEEFAYNKQFYWVTEGREIENYIQYPYLHTAMIALGYKPAFQDPGQKYDHLQLIQNKKKNMFLQIR